MSAKPPLQINVHDAKTHLSRYLARVSAGETLIIARSGKPIAKLAPVDAAVAARPSILGALRGHGAVGDLPRPSDRGPSLAPENEKLR
jgi:prevent-host-death family protein